EALPVLYRDTSDRNRTSPFAFTGNKFEFRMLGSSNSIACANIMLNSAVAESLRIYADRLEQADDFETELNSLIRDSIRAHKRIIFNGNGYDDAWVKEAEKRGLLNLRTTPDALPYFLHEKNVALFTAHRVFSREEMESRYEIMLENYNKLINIEARTMINLASKDILPAVSRYSRELSATALSKKTLSPDIDCSYETQTVTRISSLIGSAYRNLNDLRDAVEQMKNVPDGQNLAFFCKDHVIPAMRALRDDVDALELIVSSESWPYPSIGQLLFGVR
ncbi:MAG: glutamine synthetase type III, partial [Clostridia bacterium]|nr:glutamine synthetase type III [Clostridia bacterium]